NRNRLTYVIDNGSGKTLHEGDLRNVAPASGPDPGVGPGASNYGYYLTFFLPNEKATSQVYSASRATPTGVKIGYLTVVTFSPDTINPCGGQGSSYRYRFFYLNGSGGYNIGTPTGTYADFRETMGSGFGTGSETISASGFNNEVFQCISGCQSPTSTPGAVTSRSTNWREITQ
ncbi:MAG TPA: hypothetical protein VF376_13435, partial [Thermoanaerobaculia bacterium]